MHTFGRVGIVGATCGVDVVVSRPPTRKRWVYPSLHLEGSGLRFFAYDKLTPLLDGFGSASDFKVVFSGREDEALAVESIYLGVKVEVRR
jgi:hypothetical protein